MTWSTHSRRIDPINRSTKAFCQGDAGAIGLSLRMPMARNRRLSMALKMRSRSRMRYRGALFQGKASVMRNPFSCRMSCDVDPDKISAVQPKNDECRKQVETYRRHDKQIHRGDIRGMIAQKGPPTLAQWPPELGHILPTLDSETSNPSLSSSPWMRGAPHNGFSWLICRISARNSV